MAETAIATSSTAWRPWLPSEFDPQSIEIDILNLPFGLPRHGKFLGSLPTYECAPGRQRAPAAAFPALLPISAVRKTKFLAPVDRRRRRRPRTAGGADFSATTYEAGVEGHDPSVEAAAGGRTFTASMNPCEFFATSNSTT